MTYEAQTTALKAPRRFRTLALAGAASAAMLLIGIGVGHAVGSANAPVRQAQVAGIHPPARTVTVTVTATPTAPPTATPVAAAPAPAGRLTSFSDGSYEIGVDVQPGKYKTPGSGTCYWERAKNDSGELDAIIANDNVNGPVTVTLKAGETFKSKRCGTWIKS